MRTKLAAMAALAAALACSKDLVCPRGEVDCAGSCVSLLSDAANCGACGARCGPRALCAGGACGCETGAAACGAACADLASDPVHCGACDVACAGTDVCSTSGGSTACGATCAAGLTDCDRACVDLAADAYHCGACGHACAPGETCRDGACAADLYVACPITNDVRRATAGLGSAGSPLAAGDGPTSLASVGATLWAANTGFGASTSGVSSLTGSPLDARHATVETPFAGADLELVVAHGNVLVVSDDAAQALLVFDPLQQAVLGQVPLATADDPAPFPHGIAFVNDVAYVALAGSDSSPGGQEIAVVDFAGLGTCADPSAPACGGGGSCAAGRTCVGGRCRTPCGAVLDRIPLGAGADPGGKPFPWSALAVGSTVYVTLGNMIPGDWTHATWRSPAGDGKLAALDTSSGAVAYVDLGGGCANANGIALAGATLWVTCAWSGSHAAVPVTLPGVAGAPLDLSAFSSPAGSFTPAPIAFCGGMGYVGDMLSGTVVRFDPAGVLQPVGAEICPAGAAGFSYVGDFACP